MCRARYVALDSNCSAHTGNPYRPRGTESITVRIVRVCQTKLLVFVNNEDDKNEECMEVTVVYNDRVG